MPAISHSLGGLMVACEIKEKKIILNKGNNNKLGAFLKKNYTIVYLFQLIFT